MGKLDNNRKFSGGGPRPDKAKAKAIQANDRKAAYDGLSVEKKIEKLNQALGVNVGAKKQRAKLAAMLERNNAPLKLGAMMTDPIDGTDMVPQEEQEGSQKKRMKAKERRQLENKKD
jgi:hypothetical protein